jgi:hypothetical protein
VHFFSCDILIFNGFISNKEDDSAAFSSGAFTYVSK